MRRAATAGAVLALAAGGLMGAGGDALAAATHTVTLKNVAFHSTRVVVDRGDTVRWVWRDGVIAHNVTSKGRMRFASSRSKNKGIYSVRFTKAGTYRYSCTIHFGMNGTVVVR